MWSIKEKNSISFIWTKLSWDVVATTAVNRNLVWFYLLVTSNRDSANESRGINLLNSSSWRLPEARQRRRCPISDQQATRAFSSDWISHAFRYYALTRCDYMRTYLTVAYRVGLYRAVSATGLKLLRKTRLPERCCPQTGAYLLLGSASLYILLVSSTYQWGSSRK